MGNDEQVEPKKTKGKLIELICEKTCLKFQYEVKRGRRPVTHPEIRRILTEACNFGWYQVANKIINEGRERGYTSIEQFTEALRNAEQSTHHSTHSKFYYLKKDRGN